MPLPPRLLIVGASARAAAFSACRAGWLPVTIDLFDDADLQQVADSRRVESLSNLARLESELPAIPWMFTGGIENHPDLIQKFSQQRRLWGTPAEGVAAVRDPRQVEDILRQSGIPCLEIREQEQPPPPDGGWMLKPRCGGGGRGIGRWLPSATTSPTFAEPHFFQKWIAGPSYSATFLALPDKVALLQVSRQLFTRDPGACPQQSPMQTPEMTVPGTPQTDDYPFAGNLAPIDLPLAILWQLQQIGSLLATAFPLRGLFGGDFILQGGTPWLVEINPRLTASMELLEPRLSIPLLELHRLAVEAFESGIQSQELEAIVSADVRSRSRVLRPVTGVFGKQIVFAVEDGVTGAFPPGTSRQAISAGCLPLVADIPRPGQLLHPGDPLCTVFAWGATEAGCLEELHRRQKMALHWVTSVGWAVPTMKDEG